MNRRTVLAGVGSALAASSAGCLVDGEPSANASNDGPSETTEETDTPDESGTSEAFSEYPIDTDGFRAFDPDRTAETIDVGSRSGVASSYGPHHVDIWNAAGVPAVDVRITDATDESVVYRETNEIPDDAALSISLLDPSPYRLEIRLPATGSRQTLRIPCRFFDCNYSTTRIGLFENGEIAASVLATTAACSSATC